MKACSSAKFNGKIYVVGDSTVCDYTVPPQTGLDSGYMPRYGYATQLYKYLNCRPRQIVNLAASGRSSLDFLALPNYATVKNNISAGDYLIIGFGHNDEKHADPARYTNPNKSCTDASAADGVSFQYNLYENYIKPARSVGATPILCTPIVRYDRNGGYSGAFVHITEHGDYADAIRTLGKAVSVTVIDLTEITKAIYLADNNAARYFHAHNSCEGNVPCGMDGTHLNRYGAKTVAYHLARALLKTDCPLKAHVLANAPAPTMQSDFPSAINIGYVRPEYKPFAPSMRSSNYSIAAQGWYGTAMGDLVGSSLSSFKVSEAGGVFTVSAADNQGKICDGADGFAAAFMQIGSGKNFIATAKALVEQVTENAGNGSAFGLMLRDDIYIDTVKDGLNSTYLAAGVIDNKTAIFSRESRSLFKQSNSVRVEVGSVFDLSIERNGQKLYLTVAGGAQKFAREYSDLQIGLKAVDAEFMYLCLFAAGGLTVRFSDVAVRITGDAGAE